MPRWIALLAFSGLLLQTPHSRLSQELWNSSRDIYDEILRHPFLGGLVDGSLSREAFAFYMIQDARYLREFARALNITASKAPREEWALLLTRHSVQTLDYEGQLHAAIFRKYGISSEQVAGTEASPEAFGYTNFLMATAYGGSFAESMAALLPCYWIYWEVGKELKKLGSKDPIYQSWIDTYASEEYGESVRAVLEIIDEVAGKAGSEELKRMRENYRRGARYEWMFWDSAYHRRAWPPSPKKP